MVESGQQDVRDVIAALRRDLDDIRTRRRAKIRHGGEAEGAAARPTRALRAPLDRVKSLPFAVPAGIAVLGGVSGACGFLRTACFLLACAVCALAWFVTEAGPEDAELLRELAAKVDDLEERSGHLTAGTPEAARRLEEEFRELQVLVEKLGTAMDRQPEAAPGESFD